MFIVVIFTSKNIESGNLRKRPTNVVYYNVSVRKHSVDVDILVTYTFDFDYIEKKMTGLVI